MQEWLSENLWDKAAEYFQFAFSLDQNDGKFPLHATFGLELLGKAALAKIHPVLIADPRGEGRDILYAFGVSHKSPKTIQASTVFNRLTLLVDQFSSEDENICQALAERRNAEVHSGLRAYEGFSNGKWLPDFFRVVIKLTDFIGRDLEELLGSDLAKEARESADNLAAQVKSLVLEKIATAKKTVAALRAEELEARRSASEKAWLTDRMQGRFMVASICPACDSRGRLGMVHVRDKPATLSEDNEVVLTEIYAPRTFNCKVCDLSLEGVSELKLADLADHKEFVSVEAPSDYFLIEHDYQSYDGPEYDNE